MEGGTDNDLLSLEEDKKEERERGDAPVNGSEGKCLTFVLLSLLVNIGNSPSFMAEPSTENLELAEKAKLYGISVSTTKCNLISV